MCEFLVQSADRNIYGDKGDIVVIMPNDWNWAAGEKDTKIFVIIKCPLLDFNVARATYKTKESNEKTGVITQVSFFDKGYVAGVQRLGGMASISEGILKQKINRR